MDTKSFEGKPNLSELEFVFAGVVFKVSNWFDYLRGVGAAKLEQDGVLLDYNESLFHDPRKPLFNLQVALEGESRDLKIYVFGFSSPKLRCLVDDKLVYGPSALPGFLSIWGNFAQWAKKLPSNRQRFLAILVPNLMGCIYLIVVVWLVISGMQWIGVI